MASGDLNPTVIDGSKLEGGGQILRNSISLACILKKKVSINNIRAGRKTPGLSNQHLAGINLANKISNGYLSHCKIGSQELTFSPGGLHGGEFASNIDTAGSTSLLAQIAVPILLFCDTPTKLSLTGGTDVDFAPPVYFYKDVFTYYAQKMGISINVNLKRRGFFPKGQGSVFMEVQPVNSIAPIVLTDRGDILRVRLTSYVAGVLPIKMAYEMQQAAEQVIKQNYPNLSVEAQVVKEDSQHAFGNGSGILLLAETSTGCLLSSSVNGRRGVSAYDIGKEAGDSLVQDIQHSGCVDSHMQDQLIILMALAKGESILRSGPITLHTKTAIFIAELLTEAKFSITEMENKSNCFEIRCTGVGYTNNSS